MVIMNSRSDWLDLPPNVDATIKHILFQRRCEKVEAWLRQARCKIRRGRIFLDVTLHVTHDRFYWIHSYGDIRFISLHSRPWPHNPVIESWTCRQDGYYS